MYSWLTPVALSLAQCCPCSAQLISHVGPNLGLLVVSSLSDANLKFHPSVPPHQMAAHLYQDTISAPHCSFISPASSWMLYCCLISNDGVNLHIIGCARCGGGVAPDTSWHNWPALLTALGHALPSSAHFSHLQTRQSRNAAQEGNRCVTEYMHGDQLLTFCSRFGFLDL